MKINSIATYAYIYKLRSIWSVYASLGRWGVALTSRKVCTCIKNASALRLISRPRILALMTPNPGLTLRG
ncbi:hypothetical protein COCOBI_pt-1170 (chloroplast) [Coccomyxa sp. Obi]|nr:hypothetical protein COCOBI_pt-1170 [Coccomyxa sp. Obi]